MTPIAFDYPISVAIFYYGGTTGDLADTTETVGNLKEALESRGHKVRVFEVNRKNWRSIGRIPGEVCFNLVEDETWDLYLKVGKLLENLGRGQVGQDMIGLKYTVKKAKIKKKMHYLGIPTPDFRIVTRRNVKQLRSMEYPLIVKPSGQHAGIGISQDSVVIDEQELHERMQYLFKTIPGEVVVEEYIDGREIHVTVIGNGKKATVLPYSELLFVGEYQDNWNVYSYNAKWAENTWEYWNVPVVSPAKVNKILDMRIERAVMAAYRAFGCRDITRFDLRVDEQANKPYIVDVNMSPSLCRNELDATWLSAKALGWKYEDLIETIVAICYKRVYGRLPDRMRERQFLLSGPRLLG